MNGSLGTVIQVLMGVIGGLGIFLFGMHYMSEALQRIAGNRLKSLLALLTRRPIYAVLVGLSVTALVQSSSATTVTLVGFVNAGLMPLRQAIATVMGCNIGTTVTAWIIGINITKTAPLLIGVGCFMVLFLSSRKWMRIGQVILGFGLLFFGLIVMKEGVAPLRDHPMIVQAFQSFSHNPFLALLVGVAVTMLFQSSSATIGMAIVLAQQGLLDYYGAVPLILGDNIGTTITAELAALRASVDAKRLARAHTLFNCIGVLWIFPLILGPGLFQQLIIAITPLDLSPQTVGVFIANTHTCFNVVNTLVLLPFVPVLERLAIRMTRREEAAPAVNFRYLEPHLLQHPSLALEMVRRETSHMLEVADKGFDTAVQGLLAPVPGMVADAVGEIEEQVDVMQLEVTRYMVDLSQRDLSQQESDQLPALMHTVNDIERVSDHALNIAQGSDNLAGNGVQLSDIQRQELATMQQYLDSMFTLIGRLLQESNGQAAQQAMEIEQEIDKAEERFRAHHIERLRAGATDYLGGMVFLDTINNFEKIGDHLANIAEAGLRSFHFDAGEVEEVKEVS